MAIKINKHLDSDKCPNTKKKFELIEEMGPYCITPDFICSSCKEIVMSGAKHYKA